MNKRQLGRRGLEVRDAPNMPLAQEPERVREERPALGRYVLLTAKYRGHPIQTYCGGVRYTSHNL